MRHISILLTLVLLACSAVTPAAAQDTPPHHFADNAHAHVPDGMMLVEGDIVMPADAGARAAYQTWFWTNSTIYYDFAPSINSTNRARMRAAMDEIQVHAGVTFVPRSGQSNYIYVVEEGGNWSSIGMVGGMQKLSMHDWSYKFVIVHELMHALGIWHEQSRTDRDNYITINYGNIQAGKSHNFDKRTGSLTLGAYDFCSVMHYSRYAFSANGQPTITAKSAYTSYNSCMGNLSSLTSQDKATLGTLFPKSGLTGDRPGTAFTVSGGTYTHTISTAGYTTTFDEPAFACSVGGAAVGKTVWYRVTPSKEQFMEVHASGFDTVVGVFSGPPTGLFLEACVDNYGTGSTEWLGVPMRAGTTYYIGIGGWGGASGTLNLEVRNFRNVLSNSSLDWGASPWKKASVPSVRADDKQKCGRSGAFASVCSIMFKGGAREGSSFKQTVKPAKMAGGWPFVQGNSLWLGFGVNSGASASKVSLKATITFLNGTKQKLNGPTISGPTGGYYIAYENAPLQRSDVKKVVVVVTNKSGTGKTFVDNIVLVSTTGVGLRGDDALMMSGTHMPEKLPVAVRTDLRRVETTAPDGVLPPPPPSS